MKIELSEGERAMLLSIFSQVKLSRHEWRTLVEPFLVKLENADAQPGTPPEVE